MTDTLYDLTAGVSANGGGHGLAGIPILGIDPHLDQFVVLQRRVDLFKNRFRQSGTAGEDYGFEFVCQGTQMTFLFFRQ